MANKKYKLSDSDYWETSGVYDITEGKTQRQINAAKVPNTRTVNGKALSADITLSSEDIGDDSGAGGANVKASLAALKGSINDLNDITGDGALSGFTATDLTGAANELKGSLNTKIKYYPAQSVGTGTNVELFRITDTDINTATIAVALEIIEPDNITSSINWQSYNGYISFTGTCNAATAANVVLANR